MMPRPLFPLLVSLLALGCATTPDSGWWTYRKDASNSAKYLEDDVGPALTLVWEQSFATTDAPAAAVGSPVFGSGRVYVAVMSNNTQTDRLAALRASDGQEEWSFSPLGAVGFIQGRPPVVADGRVYTVFDVGSSTSDRGSRVFALGPNGNVQWTWSTEVPGAAVIEGPLTAAGGVVLFSTWHAVTLESHLVALRPDTGAVAWRVSIGQRRPRHGPVVFGQHVVLATDTDVLRFRLDSGAEVWQRAYPVPGRTGPITLYRFSPHEPPWILVPVVITTDGYVTFKVRVHTVGWAGSLVNTYDFPVTGDRHMGVSFLTMDAGQGIVFAGTSIIGFAGPNTLWTVTDPDGHVLQSTPALTSDHVFFTNSRRLHVLRPRDGSIAWSGDEATREDGGPPHASLIGGVAIDQGLVAAVGYQRLQVFRPSP